MQQQTSKRPRQSRTARKHKIDTKLTNMQQKTSKRHWKNKAAHKHKIDTKTNCIFRPLGCLRRVFGRSLGRSWGFGAVLGGSVGDLWGSWEALGASRGDLGAYEQNEHEGYEIRPPFSSLNGTQDGAEIDKITIPKLIKKTDTKPNKHL